MRRRVIFRGKSVEDVAREFAQIVSRNYVNELKFCQALAMDDKEEYEDWEVKIINEPGIVRQNAYDKVLRIIKDPQGNAAFYMKKSMIFSRREVISIVISSGFYNDLLPGEHVEMSQEENVEYIIDTKKLTIAKNVQKKNINL